MSVAARAGGDEIGGGGPLEELGEAGEPAADHLLSAVPDLSSEQDLLWGPWGGVVVIAALLITVVVVLAVTVGALPL